MNNTTMNPVVHFELPAEDRKRAAAFYTKAFGWETKMWGEDMGNYVTVKTSESTPDETGGRPTVPGAINGGIYEKADDPLRSHPSVVIAVDDLEASMEKVKVAGGTIHGEPVAIPQVGRFVSFTDTEGNALSMLQPQM